MDRSNFGKRHHNADSWRYPWHHSAACTRRAGARALDFAAEMEFRRVDYKGLEPIVKAFLTSTAGQPSAACFDVADPVIDGRAHLTNPLSAVSVHVIKINTAPLDAPIYGLEQAILIDWRASHPHPLLQGRHGTVGLRRADRRQCTGGRDLVRNDHPGL
jgi:hypothetical protein